MTIALYTSYLYAAANNKTKNPVKPNQAKPLSKGQGYLLVKMDVTAVAPSLTVDRLKNEGELYLDTNESRTFEDEEFTVALKGVEKGFYLIRLPAGLYQITQVNVPYFNLPFKLDTSKNTAWRFGIAEGQTNYIGTLFVDKERSSELVNVALYNRYATDKQTISADYPTLLSSASLRNGIGVRDDFEQLLKVQDD